MIAMTGSGQPTERRVASSSTTIRTPPSTTSVVRRIADAESQIIERDQRNMQDRTTAPMASAQSTSEMPSGRSTADARRLS